MHSHPSLPRSAAPLSVVRPSHFLSPRTACTLPAAMLATLATLAAMPAYAERIALEPTVVIAARYVQPAAQATANVTVLEAADLAADAALPVEDILARHAGVTLARTGGAGQQVSVFLRGSESDSTLVLVDGVNINGGTLGNAALQNLRGEDIERIEVVRGPRSTLYGSEAIGGVISITTKRAAREDSQSLYLGGGSHGTVQARADASRAFGGTQLAASLGHFRTDGEPVTTRTPVTGEHDNTHGKLSLATQAGATRYRLDAWAAQGTTQYVECAYDPVTFACTAINPQQQGFNNSVLSLGSETRLGTQDTLRVRLGEARDELDQRNSADFAHTHRLAGAVEWEDRRGGNTLVAGVDAERESVQALSTSSFGNTNLVAVNDNRAAFLRNDLRLDVHQLALGLRNAVYDSFGEHWTGEASYGLHAGRDTFGWLAWGRGFRAPDSSERFGGGGNPLLRPETTDSAEAGVRRQFGAHEVTATGFVQHIEDLVDYPPPAWTATNIARARITGTELGWRWHADSTRLHGAVTLLDAVDDSTGTRLSRRPEHQASLASEHGIGRITLQARLLAMGERDNSAYDAIRLPAFVTGDLGLRWAVAKTMTLDARVENVGDADYLLAGDTDVGNYRSPGRGVFAGIEWRP